MQEVQTLFSRALRPSISARTKFLVRVGIFGGSARGVGVAGSEAKDLWRRDMIEECLERKPGVCFVIVASKQGRRVLVEMIDKNTCRREGFGRGR